MDRLRDADTTLVVPNPLDIPPPGSIHDKPGFFIDCDLEAGFLGTPLRAYWANMITECIRNAILKAGLVPTYTDWTQLGVAIEKIAERIAKFLIEQALNDLEFVQQGGNVSGTIKNKKFTLNAPAPPASLTQDGGNVTGSISISGGTFTLNASGGGGGGGGSGVDKFIDLTDTPDVYSGSATDGNLLFSRDNRIDYTGGATNAAWSPGGLGVENGAIGASGGDGGVCLRGGTKLDGSQSMNFTDCVGLAVSQAPDPAKNWLAGYANIGALQAKITMDGVFHGKNLTIQAADYAEWFETGGGLPLAPGLAVVLKEGRVQAATAQDDPADIIGVTRPADTRLALIGNAAESHWAGMYLTDAFGAPVWADVTDVDGPAYRTQALNPAYDPSRPYIPRSRRPEWVLVGLVGQVPVLTGQSLGDRWRVMRPVSETVTLVYIR